MSTTAHTDPDVYSSEAILPEQQDGLQQLKSKIKSDLIKYFGVLKQEIAVLEAEHTKINVMS